MNIFADVLEWSYACTTDFVVIAHDNNNTRFDSLVSDVNTFRQHCSNVILLSIVTFVSAHTQSVAADTTVQYLLDASWNIDIFNWWASILSEFTLR